MKKLRLREPSVFGGVCQGLAQYFNIDVAFVRLLFTIGLFFLPFIVTIYLILFIALPVGDGD